MSNSTKKYETYDAAKAALDVLMGWPDAEVRDVETDDGDIVYVVCCEPDQGKYLMNDGYVR